MKVITGCRPRWLQCLWEVCEEGHQNKVRKDRVINNAHYQLVETQQDFEVYVQNIQKNKTKTLLTRTNTTNKTTLFTLQLRRKELQAAVLSVHQLSLPLRLRGIFPGLTATNSWEKRGCRKLWDCEMHSKWTRKRAGHSDRARVL